MKKERHTHTRKQYIYIYMFLFLRSYKVTSGSHAIGYMLKSPPFCIGDFRVSWLWALADRLDLDLLSLIGSSIVSFTRSSSVSEIHSDPIGFSRSLCQARPSAAPQALSQVLPDRRTGCGCQMPTWRYLDASHLPKKT